MMGTGDEDATRRYAAQEASMMVRAQIGVRTGEGPVSADEAEELVPLLGPPPPPPKDGEIAMLLLRRYADGGDDLQALLDELGNIVRAALRALSETRSRAVLPDAEARLRAAYEENAGDLPVLVYELADIAAAVLLMLAANRSRKRRKMLSAGEFAGMWLAQYELERRGRE